MNVQEFRDDDAAYATWSCEHPGGYVINIQRTLNPTDARLHRAGCRSISAENLRIGRWTSEYIKLCADELADLDAWSIEHGLGAIARCAICNPAHDTAPRATSSSPGSEAIPGATAALGVRGPLPGRPTVEAWAEGYIQFERRPAWQEQLRSQLGARIRQLQAEQDQVLHATFFGPKPERADIENLTLYNIDETGAAFSESARFGLRFELGAGSLKSVSVDGAVYAYRYELTPRAAGFRYWRESRTLAAWGWVDLGRFAGDYRLEQVWLALARARVPVARPARRPGTAFGVELQIRVPLPTALRLVRLVKPLIDGVVCAFQSHTDTSSISDVATRLSRRIDVPPKAVGSLLLDDTMAVLGSVPHLVRPRGNGVIWAPADDQCLAGELLLDNMPGSWAIRGRIVELRAVESLRTGAAAHFDG